MNEIKPKILVYKVLPDELASVSQYYENQFEVIDESTCFTDILAIPAVMVILNPEALTQDEYALLNEVFYNGPQKSDHCRRKEREHGRIGPTIERKRYHGTQTVQPTV